MTRSTGAPARARQGRPRRCVGAGVPQRVVQGLLGDPQQRLLLGGGQGAHLAAGEGDAARCAPGPGPRTWVRSVGDQAVLVQGGGAQLDDDGAQLVGGLGGERGDLLELALGPAGVAVDQGGGGLGGQPQREELLGDGVVQLVGDAGALAGDGQLAAALVEAGVGEGDGGVRRRGCAAGPRLLGEAARPARLAALARQSLVGEEDRAEDLVAVADRQAEEVRHLGVGARASPRSAGARGRRRAAAGSASCSIAASMPCWRGQRADRLPLLVADAVDHELGEAAVVVGHAEGGVLARRAVRGRRRRWSAGPRDLQVPAHREHRGAHRVDTASRRPWLMPPPYRRG